MDEKNALRYLEVERVKKEKNLNTNVILKVNAMIKLATTKLDTDNKNNDQKG